MNALPRGSIVKGRGLHFENKTTFRDYKLTYPLHQVKACVYTVTVNKIGDYAHAVFSIKADLVLVDAIDGALFDQTIVLDEDCDLLEEMDEQGEGYLVTGNVIDLDDVALRIIISSFPIKVTRQDSKLPQNGSGYRVMSEKENAEEKQAAANPSFDKLKDLEEGK